MTRLMASKRNTVSLIRNQYHLGSESGADELPTHRAFLAVSTSLGLLLGDGLKHLGDGGTVLGIEVGVDLVEEVEGRGVALLDCEDEGESA